jgi:predicted enzyme related to lactoylglutathione lyase
MAKHPVIHFEIASKDPDALGAFYAKAFDWSLDSSTYPGGGAGIPKYIVARPTGEEFPNGYGINGGIGGVCDGYDGHVTFYIRVDDIEAALQKVEALGGKRVMGPADVPNGPSIGLFTDPQGHVVGLVDPRM